MPLTAIETALRIARAATANSALRAFIDYSDALHKADAEARLELCAGEPPSTGSPAWDAALAGIVELRLNDVAIASPDWINAPSRFCTEPQSPQLGRYDLEPDLNGVPDGFLRRNILLERATLQSF